MLKVNDRILPNTVIRVVVAGEIDMATVEELTLAMTAAITRHGVTAVEVDFAGVSFCDSSGLAALDKAYARAAQHSIPFRLIDPQPGVRRILQLTGLLEVLVNPQTA